MKRAALLIFTLIVLLLAISVCNASDKEFGSEKMMLELEKQLDLSSEKIAKLKPSIDVKSKELKKSIQESVDKGFVELDEMTGKLDKMTKETEAKVRSFLSSEEVQKLKDYLSKLDKNAINEAKNKLVAELSAVLELTEDQLSKLKPVLEDSMLQLSQMVEKLTKEGNKSWGEFKKQYQELSKDLKEKLQETLDNNQMDRLEKYNKEKQEKIQEILFV